jgi:hypothetical protein
MVLVGSKSLNISRQAHNTADCYIQARSVAIHLPLITLQEAHIALPWIESLEVQLKSYRGTLLFMAGAT